MIVGVIAFVSLITVLCLWWHLKREQIRSKLPPGPRPWPILGTMHLMDKEEPQKTMAEWGKKYGGLYTMWLSDQPAIVITDYELLKESLIKQGDNFSARPRIFLFEHFAKGRYGIINQDGNFWKEQRRFTISCLRDLGFGKTIMEDKIMIEVEKLINWIDDDIKENRHDSSLDLELPLQFCVGNIISSIVLGHSFEKDDPHFVHLKEIVDENFRLLSDPKTGFLQAFPWFRFVPYLKRISNYDAFCRLDKIFRKFLDGEIEWNKKNVDMEKDATNYTTAYLKELNKRQTSEESTGSFSEWQLHFTLADLWIAGMETTVTTLKWAFLYLILNPDVQEKIFKEIQSVIGSDKKPQLTDKVNMPYTQAAINEIQRMGNIVPINLVHTVFQDTQVGKYRIPEGVVVIPQISSVHMDADYFPDPDKFDPKRYLDSDEKSITKIDQLVPFSMGKRICLGESLAKMELFLIITSMVQRYKFEIPFGEPEPSTKPVRSFTSSPQKYKCSISKRNL